MQQPDNYIDTLGDYRGMDQSKEMSLITKNNNNQGEAENEEYISPIS
jgi:hypothetical protein